MKPELLKALEASMFDHHEYEALEAEAFLKGQASGVEKGALQERKKMMRTMRPVIPRELIFCVRRTCRTVWLRKCLPWNSKRISPKPYVPGSSGFGRFALALCRRNRLTGRKIIMRNFSHRKFSHVVLLKNAVWNPQFLMKMRIVFSKNSENCWFCSAKAFPTACRQGPQLKKISFLSFNEQ